MLGNVHRPFVRGRRNNPRGRRLVAVRPVTFFQARAQPGIHEAPVPVDTVPARHEHRIGNPSARVIHALDVLRPFRHEPHGEGQQDVFRARARRGGVGVEVLERDAFTVYVVFGRGPVAEVLRGTALNGADPDAVLPRLFEIPAEEAVATRVVIPKGHVHRVEGARDREGAVLHRFPGQPVG